MATHGCIPCGMCGARCSICNGCNHYANESTFVWSGITSPDPEMLAFFLKQGPGLFMVTKKPEPEFDVLFAGFVEGIVYEG